MSKADTIFVNMCRDILDNGFSTEGQTVRAKWADDGAPAHTRKIFGVCNTIFMLFLLVFLLYPVLNVVAISVSNETQVMAANVTFYPIGFNPQAYTTIFKDADLWRSIGNTVFVSGVGCVLSLVALCIAAYPLAFAHFYGKKTYTLLIMFTMWFQGGIVPLFLTMQGLGLYDSLWALIFNGLISAYNVVIIRSCGPVGDRGPLERLYEPSDPDFQQSQPDPAAAAQIPGAGGGKLHQQPGYAVQERSHEGRRRPEHADQERRAGGLHGAHDRDLPVHPAVLRIRRHAGFRQGVIKHRIPQCRARH